MPIHNRRRFPWPALAVLAALAVYALPGAWHREWRLATAGAWRRAFGLVRSEDGHPRGPRGSDAEIGAAFAAGRAALLEEAAETRALLENYEIARKRYPALRLVAARLSPADSRDPAGGVLDRGSADGVAPGDAVLVGDALLGMVTDARPASAWVRYISTPGSRVAARVSPDDGGDPPPPAAAGGREICQVAGGGRGRAMAMFYALGSAAQSGWAVFTSGLEGPIPEGIYLGRLEEAPRETGDYGVLSASVALAAAPLRGIDVIVARRLE